MGDHDNQNVKRKTIGRRIVIVLLVIFASLVSLSLIIHIPAVQNWGIRQISKYLSKKTGSTVSVRAFDFNVLSHFSLQDVYISQLSAPEDTLLYAGEVGMKFSRVWKLFSGNPEIGQLRVRTARLYLDDRPITFLNLTEKKKRPGSGVQIVEPVVILDDVFVRVNKKSNPLLQEYVLPHGVIAFDEINSQSRLLQMRSISLEKPSVEFLRKQDSLIVINDVVVVPQVETATTPDSLKWMYDIGTIHLKDGSFSFANPQAKAAVEQHQIDYSDLGISDLDLEINNICIDATEMTGRISELSFIEKSGFQLDHFIAQSIGLSAQGITLGGLELNTPGSAIADTLALDFGQEEEERPFVDRVSMYARFRDTRLALKDLLQIIPGLSKSAFFAKNAQETMRINGVVRGSLDRLRGDSLLLNLGNMSFAGQFRSRNITTPGQQVLNLVVSDARFTPGDLEKHIPNLDLPDQFRRLGRIQFQGKFDGFLEDFVAFGKINTAIGRAEVDMNLETRGRIASYRGSLALRDFNLQKWTDVQDFGLISANLSVENGSGLTAETAVADITGSIQRFQYKGYTYSDAVIDGRLNQNQFNGKLELHDPNVDLSFQGAVHVQDSIPAFDFVADIRRLRFLPLHLSKDTFEIIGTFAARGTGKDLSSLDGSIQALNMVAVRGGQRYALDTVFLDIAHQDDGRRVIRTNSDYANGWIIGDFEINSLYPSLARYLEESYPQYFSGIKYRKDLSDIRHSAEFEVTLNKPDEWGGLFNLHDVRFKDLYAKGQLNFDADSVQIRISTPALHYRNINAYVVNAHLESFAGRASAGASIVAIDVDERYFFDEINASANTIDNGFSWTLAADDLLEELNTLGISGTITMDADDRYSIHVDPEIIEILDQKWELREGNRVRFGKDFIELRDIVFQHDDQVITISDIDRRGIMIETQHFDLHFIDDVWDYQKLDFAGPYTLRAGLGDIFTRREFYLLIDAPEVRVNGDSYGALRVNCEMEYMGEPASIFVGLEGPGNHIRATGAYTPAFDEIPEADRNTIDLNIDVDTFPIRFLEYFLKDGVNHTTGYTVGNLKISGPLSKSKMDGDATIYGGATTITYLGTRYFFDDQHVHVSESFIDATGATITDEAGNTASVTGGITHKRLANLGLNARIRSPRVYALKTTKLDNSIYYGTGIGSIDATFTGLLDRPTISVNAVTDYGTSIVINLTEEGASGKKSFIRFRDDVNNSHVDYRGKTLITGMNFEMNLTATPLAVIEIVLEDDPPESIIGAGNGDIQLSITRSGDFTMYGQYEIDHGNYLFRSFVVINKPFVLLEGGTIQWNGDPYNAQINLEAEYVGLRASLSTLLAEYLTNASDALKEEASRKTDIRLKLLLTGTLLEPEINFDLDFPNLSGELAGYADTKLRILKSNQNALNEQVFGLLWAGSFLPSNVLQSDASLQLAEQGVYNTMSEFLSGYVSSLFSGVISRWVEDVNFISGIDFNVGYSRGSVFDDIPDAQQSSTNYREWEVRLKNRLFNDRVILDAGANYGTDSPIGTGTYLVGDYALEYLLTEDGRLKIRFYYRNDQTIEGRKDKLGIGLAWRREFDSFDEWLGGLRKESKKIREQTADPNEYQ